MDAKFVKEATEAGLVNLKGHRTVGGMRASIFTMQKGYDEDGDIARLPRKKKKHLRVQN